MNAVRRPFDHRAGRDRPIKVLIVDDSQVARSVITRMLERVGRFEIVAAVGDGAHALQCLETLSVDVILLDLEMPGTNGIDLLPRLVAASAGAHVLVLSSAVAEGAAATVAALAAGATDTLQKPGGANFLGRFSETLVDRLTRIASLRAPARTNRMPLRKASSPAAGVECLAIGASTGGLHALNILLPALPPAFCAPILITQHLPAGFMSYFARQTETLSGRPAVVAMDGMALLPGRIVIAPGDGHLRLVRSGPEVRVVLDRTPASSGCMPSVDPMFEALASVYADRGTGVVLSGMGKDGLRGAAALARAGAEILVQDSRSSVVWGMPGAVAEAGHASAVLDPTAIAAHILERARLGA